MKNLDDIKILENDELVLRMSLGIDVSKQFYYIIYNKSNNEKIGVCGIRLEKTKDNYYLGNIEYEIDEKYRGNNYAYKACQLLTDIASKYNVDNLLITANPNNIASIKTIEKLGARFVEVSEIPKNNRLYKQGERFVSIYDWNINKEGEKRI